MLSIQITSFDIHAGYPCAPGAVSVEGNSVHMFSWRARIVPRVFFLLFVPVGYALIHVML